MFKIRAILLVSVALFFCSSVNTLPARSFLESITDNSKRQGGLYWNFCLALQKECIEVYGEYSCEHDDDYGDPFGHCRGACYKFFNDTEFRYYCMPAPELH